MRRDGIVALGLAIVLISACAAEPRAAVEETAGSETAWVGMVRNGRVPRPGVLTGGQPSDAELAALRDAGFKTVINLRQPDELGTRGEAERVAELGMAYVAIPVAGAEGLNEENARSLSAALAGAERPLLLHCGSGNRVGALLALEAFWVDGATADEALAIGAAGGLTRLEPAVRAIVEGAE